MVIGVVATLVLALVVVLVLARTGGAKAVSDNAAVIGALVALGGVFTAQMVSIALEQKRAWETRELEVRRTVETRDLEAQRARETALQNYFENVGELLIEKPLRRASPRDNLSTVVRAQTLSVLEGLDPNRKRILLRFLYESGLIDKDKPVVSLAGANLREANLHGAILSHANLRGVNLPGADLSHADLPGADLTHALLTYADLSGANLHGADLRRAFLVEADLANADLSEADLGKADLGMANFHFARGVTAEELEQESVSLEGATMPNGQKYEDWHNDRVSRKDSEYSE
jgi:uncharacterized protein YjbI with pentapeptide repeats